MESDDMKVLKDDRLLDRAKKLRKEMTPQERKLWYCFLRDYPVKVYKQRIIGEYIVDFYCASSKLVIEIDGSQHYEDSGRKKDEERSSFLESIDLKVVRFSNADINFRFQAVCDKIDQIIRSNEVEGETRI